MVIIRLLIMWGGYMSFAFNRNMDNSSFMDRCSNVQAVLRYRFGVDVRCVYG